MLYGNVANYFTCLHQIVICEEILHHAPTNDWGLPQSLRTIDGKHDRIKKM